MASITINSNISALTAQRRLGESTKKLQDSFARLSSGLRINRASDDAAGLAIASGLTTDRRVFNQGVRNLNDGLSAANIADSSVESLSHIVMRLEELAEQAANGTIGHKQRASLDAEAQALSREYFRIARSAEFNGQQLLDGSIGDVRLQGGYGESGGLLGGFGGEIGTGTFQSAVSFAATALASLTLGDLNLDGALDLISADLLGSIAVSLGNGDGSFAVRSDYTTGGLTRCVELGDVNGDGVLDLVSADDNVNQVSVMLGNGDGSFAEHVTYAPGAHPWYVALGDLNSDGVLDLATVDNTVNKASVMLGNGDGTFRARTSYSTGSAPSSLAFGDLNGDAVLDMVVTNRSGNRISALLGNGDGSFQAQTSFTTGFFPGGAKLADLNADNRIDVVFAETGDVAVMLGNGDGSFGVRTTFVSGTSPGVPTLGDVNGDGVLDVAISDFPNNQGQIMLGNGNGSFRVGVSLDISNPGSVAFGDLNGDGVVDMAGAGNDAVDGDKAFVFLAITTNGTSPLLPFDLGTMAGARQALPVFKQKLDQLSAQRGEIGVFQSRIGVALNNLQVAAENYASAASQITDADVADESAQLVKNQILQQAGSAILAQANSEPQLALKLLGGI